MKRAAIFLALLSTSLVLQAQSQQAPVFRTTGDTVPVYVTVTDKSDRLVPDLTRDDFQIFDNGKLQPLTLFDNSPQPVRLIVLLDVSGSMIGNLPLLRAASMQLFLKLRPDDRARVGTFGKEIIISPEFSGDARALVAALPQEIDPEASTPLWHAVDDAITALSEVKERRVILVLSDGKDSGPTKFGMKFYNQLDEVERARETETMIYAVGFQSRSARPMMGGNMAAMMAADLPDPGLGTAAIETGGGYFEVRPRDDLSAAFTRVADELHSQYLLGFTPPARDGKAHKIEVKLPKKDVKPRARKSYIAPKGER